ncbi:hypothetical protein Q3G72_026109 [Acer saccharum]|nr:hypothetical protein Q3G72_026109 [Acer saccharum]
MVQDPVNIGLELGKQCSSEIESELGASRIMVDYEMVEDEGVSHHSDRLQVVESGAPTTGTNVDLPSRVIVGDGEVDSSGRSGGLCLFWSNKVTVDLLSFTRYHIDMKVISYGLTIWRFTGFYRHPEAAQRHHSWSLLKRLSGMSSLPWMCVGDFNEVLVDSEKDGGSDRLRILTDNFRAVLDHCGLEDLGFSGPKFTWSNMRGGSSHVQERIDRGVCSYLWKQLFPLAVVNHLDF